MTPTRGTIVRPARGNWSPNAWRSCAALAGGFQGPLARMSVPGYLQMVGCGLLDEPLLVLDARLGAFTGQTGSDRAAEVAWLVQHWGFARVFEPDQALMVPHVTAVVIHRIGDRRWLVVGDRERLTRSGSALHVAGKAHWHRLVGIGFELAAVGYADLSRSFISAFGRGCAVIGECDEQPRRRRRHETGRSRRPNPLRPPGAPRR